MQRRSSPAPVVEKKSKAAPPNLRVALGRATAYFDKSTGRVVQCLERTASVIRVKDDRDGEVVFDYHGALAYLSPL